MCGDGSVIPGFVTFYPIFLRRILIPHADTHLRTLASCYIFWIFSVTVILITPQKRTLLTATEQPVIDIIPILCGTKTTPYAIV